MATELVIERLRAVSNGVRYRVRMGSSVLVDDTLDPECSACREYLKQFPGSEEMSLSFRRHGKSVSMTMNVGWGAKRTASEGNKKPIKFRKWFPYEQRD